jgi:ribosomal VAR1-like protein
VQSRALLAKAMDYKVKVLFLRIILLLWIVSNVVCDIEYYIVNIMYNNKTVISKKPFIFNKKIKDTCKIIPLKKVKNTLGPMRYFPPACQEWNNSIYAYNNISTKGINIAQKTLTRLIVSYFNLYFSKNLLYSKRILTRFRRLAISKIFISKAELKHTSNKVIVTLYVYNEERRRLIKRLKRMQALIFPSINGVSLNKSREEYSLLSLGKKLSFFSKTDTFSLKGWLEEIKVYIIEEIKLEKKGLLVVNNLNIRKEKLLVIKNLEENLSRISTILYSSSSDTVSLNYYENLYRKYLSKTFLEKEIAIIAYYKLLLSLNKYKFEDVFLSRLSPLISKIYNKQVEFNIVNIKAIYLNSDIFTQVIAFKLRNRDNRLLKVLRYFLSMVKLSKVNLLKERFVHINIKKLWVNRVKNLTINSLPLNVNKDRLNDLLTGIFKVSNFSNLLLVNGSTKKKNIFGEISNKSNLLNNVLLLLKHKSMAGIRLEAKGRLTRRFTASRSVFKIKWKGSLKNIDSSYRGLSSVILRGHIKSNIQYSIVNSKTRNGAFGLKGWISGK